MGSVSFKEMLGGAPVSHVPIAHQHNIEELLGRVNSALAGYAAPVTVSSGYRTLQDHYRIYDKKKIPRDKVPMRSAHLSGEALDLADPTGALQKYFTQDVLEKFNLYAEDFSATKGWVHLQTRPFGSYRQGGTRYFKP